MKRLLSIVLLALLLPLAAYCQITTNIPQSFYQTAFSYFTTFNTNLTTFQNDRADLWTGPVYKSGLNFADDLGLDILFKKGGGFYAEGVMRNAGVAGTIVSMRGGIGYAITKYDTRLSGGINGGYDLDANKGTAEVYADLKKSLTENTFAGLRIGYETYFERSKSRDLSIMASIGFVCW